MRILDRVIFLDIDGPMIPAGMFMIDSDASNKRLFSPVCVAVLKAICRVSHAKLVVNSTHNTLIRDGNTVVDDLIAAGIPVEYFHRDPMTQHPAYPRSESIERWLAKNGEADWIAFDDIKFDVENPGRLIWVDFNVGLCPYHIDVLRGIWHDMSFLIL